MPRTKTTAETGSTAISIQFQSLQAPDKASSFSDLEMEIETTFKMHITHQMIMAQTLHQVPERLILPRTDSEEIVIIRFR
jgi:hypothetical protein